LAWLKFNIVPFFKLNIHEKYTNDSIERKIHDISSHYDRLLSETKERLEQLSAIKGSHCAGNFGEQIQVIGALNDDLLHNKELFRYDSILDLKLVKLSPVWKMFTRDLKTRKMLVVRYDAYSQHYVRFWQNNFLCNRMFLTWLYLL